MADMIFVTSRLLTDTYEKAIISFPVMFFSWRTSTNEFDPVKITSLSSNNAAKKEADFEKKEMFSFLQNVHKGDKQLHVEKC